MFEATVDRGGHLSRPSRPFWGPLAAILDFAGGVALQTVSECPLLLVIVVVDIVVFVVVVTLIVGNDHIIFK